MLGYLPDPEQGAPDQDTLAIIAQVLPMAGSAEQAWSWYQTQALGVANRVQGLEVQPNETLAFDKVAVK